MLRGESAEREVEVDEAPRGAQKGAQCLDGEMVGGAPEKLHGRELQPSARGGG